MNTVNFYGNVFANKEQYESKNCSLLSSYIEESKIEEMDHKQLTVVYEEDGIEVGDICYKVCLNGSNWDGAKGVQSATSTPAYIWVQKFIIKEDVAEIKSNELNTSLYYHMVKRQNGSYFPLPLLYSSDFPLNISEEEIAQLKTMLNNKYGI